MKALKLFFFAIAISSLIHCTRNGDSAKMNLSIPIKNLTHQNFMRSQTVDLPPLQTLIVNVQTSGGPPLFRQIDYGDDNPAPSTIDVVFESAPNVEGMLVQVLGVFGGNGGGMQLRYGDAIIPANKDVTVNLSSTGTTITKQAYLAGRLKVGSIYPTGTLVAKFQPAPGKPAMAIDQSAIVGGYFNIFSVSNGTTGATAPTFDYVWVEGQPGGLTVFTGLNPDLNTGSCTASSTNGSCPYDFISSGQVKIHKPASYSRTGKANSPGIRGNSEMEYVLGFFGGAPGTVCYPNDVTESLPGLFAAGPDLTATPNFWQTPMDINLGGGAVAPGSYSATATQYAGGGTGVSGASLFTDVGACTRSSGAAGSSLILNHTLLGNNDEDFAGFRAPWMMIQPFAGNGSKYLSVNVAAMNANSTFSNGDTTLTISSAVAPIQGSIITDNAGNFAPGTIITNVGGTSTPYTVDISTAVTGTGGSSLPLKLSAPYSLLWQTIPGLVSTYALNTTATSNTVLNSYLSAQAPPFVNFFALSSPPFITGTVLKAIGPGAGGAGYYDFTFSNPASQTMSSQPVGFSPISGIEVWAKYTMNLQATLTGGSNVILKANVIPSAYANGIKAGMPINGGTGTLNIPADTIVSAVDATSITLSANVTGTGTSSAGINVGKSASNHTDDCGKLPDNGFQMVVTYPPNVSTPILFYGLPNLPPGDNINYEVALCAAQKFDSGKVYYGRSITGRPTYAGDSQSMAPFGWAHSSKVDPVNGAGVAPVTVGMAAMRVSAAFTYPSNGYSVINVTSVPPVVAGDEIMIRVMGQVASGCGNGFNVGDFTYARVLRTTTGTIYIPSGTWADRLVAVPNLTTPYASMASQVPSCFVQAMAIPHYRDLHLGAVVATTPFDYGDNDTGMLGFRVNGKLTLDGSIDMSGVGFRGANTNTPPYAYYGAGIYGPSNQAFGTGNGGLPPPYASSAEGGGGGGGFGSGSGGYVPDGNFGGTGMGFNDPGKVSFNMGGGGAGTNSGVEAGSGGGVIAIAANRLTLTTNVTFKANGGNFVGNYSGGGGGGSVNIVANQISASAPKTVSLQARGGSGGDGTTTRGGAGGGGFTTLMSCDVGPNVTIGPSDVAAGVAATTPGAANGLASSYIGVGGNNNWWCN